MNTPRCPRCLRTCRHIPEADRYRCEPDSTRYGGWNSCGDFPRSETVEITGDVFGLATLRDRGVSIPPSLEAGALQYAWLGMGGMGVVLGLLDEQGNLQRDPVIKVLLPKRSTLVFEREARVLEYLRARKDGQAGRAGGLMSGLLRAHVQDGQEIVFQEERRTGAIQDHMKIPTALEGPAPWPLFHAWGTGTAGERELRYLVMEGIDGKLLGQAMKETEPAGRFRQLKTYFRFACKLARAVRDLHREGLVHGDIKPSNAMVDGYKEDVVLLDLGAAAVAVNGVTPAEARVWDMTYADPEDGSNWRPRFSFTKRLAPPAPSGPLAPGNPLAKNCQLTPAWDVHCLGKTLEWLMPADEDLVEVEWPDRGVSQDMVQLAREIETRVLEPMKALVPGNRPSMDEVCDWLEDFEKTQIRKQSSGHRTYLARLQQRPQEAGIGESRVLYTPLSIQERPPRPEPGPGGRVAAYRAPGTGKAVELETLFYHSDLPLVAVVGDPGVGKTTLLRHILGRGVEAALRETSPAPLEYESEPAICPPAGSAYEVPVYLHLKHDVWRHWVKHSDPFKVGLPRCIEERFGDQLAEVRGEQEQRVGFLAEPEVRWLLLLDALDEVPQRDRQQLLGAITEWVLRNHADRVRCILTCRVADWDGWPGLPALPDGSAPRTEVVLERLSGDTLQTFVRTYAGSLGFDAAQLLQELEQPGRARLKRAMQWARFAAQICRDFASPQGLADRLEETYERQLVAYLDDRHLGGPPSERVLLARDHKRTVLCWLAFVMLGERDDDGWSSTSLLDRINGLLQRAMRGEADQGVDGCRLARREVTAMLRELVRHPQRADLPEGFSGWGDDEERKLDELGRQLLYQLGVVSGMLPEIADGVHYPLDRSWWGYLASDHARSRLPLASPRERQASLRDLAKRIGFDLEAHRFDDTYEDCLFFLAEWQEDPAFLDALWRVNKLMALRCYEISGRDAQQGSIIDRLLCLEDSEPELRNGPEYRVIARRSPGRGPVRLRDLWHEVDWKAHGVEWERIEPVSERAALTEALLCGSEPRGEDGYQEVVGILPWPEAVTRWDGEELQVVREDGSVLYLLGAWLRRLLEQPGAREAWPGRVWGILFESNLDLLPPRWVKIPAGTYAVGSEEENDNPPHEVVLGKTAGELYAFPVTCGEYELLDPFHARRRFGDRVQGDGEPVVEVSWYEALVWALRNGYDLPTEALWEVAASHGGGERGGQPHVYPWGAEMPDEKRAWYDRQDHEGTSSVRDRDGEPSREAGAADWGRGGKIYDLSGNVWEWCQDWYGDIEEGSRLEDPRGPAAGGGRVLRGGSWYDFYAHSLRAAYRYDSYPLFRLNFIGFRCSRAVPLGFDPFAL